MISAWFIPLSVVIGIVVTKLVGHTSFNRGYSEGFDDAEELFDWSKGVKHD